MFSYDIYGVDKERIKGNGSVLAIGNFDGLHRGHMLLIKDVLRNNRDLGKISLAVTFDYSNVPDYHRRHLMTQLEKIDALLSAGLEGVVVLPFDSYLKHLSPGAFVNEVLKNELNLHYLVAGEDFRFGYRAAGDVNLLKELAMREHFKLNIIPRWNYRGKETSSTEIRRLLIAGDSLGASRILGKPYVLSGEVVHGEHVGRTLGFPTANIEIERTKLIPANGVYLAEASINRQGCYPSVVNIGYRPTFQGKHQSVEVHLLNFEKDIYGDILSIELGSMIRNEKTFGSKEALANQIDHDVTSAKSHFDRNSVRENFETTDLAR